MALPGDSRTMYAHFSWTRGEFSTGSTTRLYESTSSGITGSQIASQASSITTKSISKTVYETDAAYTRYYRVKHALSTGSLSSSSNVVSVTWQYAGGA